MIYKKLVLTEKYKPRGHFYTNQILWGGGKMAKIEKNGDFSKFSAL